MKVKIFFLILFVVFSQGNDIEYSSLIKISKDGFQKVLKDFIKNPSFKKYLNNFEEVIVKTNFLTSASEEDSFEQQGNKQFIFLNQTNEENFEKRLHIKIMNSYSNITNHEKNYLIIENGTIDILIGIDFSDNRLKIVPTKAQLSCNISFNSSVENVHERGNNYINEVLGKVKNYSQRIRKFIENREFDLTSEDDERIIKAIHEIKEINLTKDYLSFKFLFEIKGLEDLVFEIFEETNYEHEISFLKNENKEEKHFEKNDIPTKENQLKDFFFEIKDKSLNDFFKLLKEEDLMSKKFKKKIEKVVVQMEEQDIKDSYESLKDSEYYEEMDIKIKLMKPKYEKYIEFRNNNIIIILPFEISISGESNKILATLDYDLIKNDTSSILKAKEISIKTNSEIVSTIYEYEDELKHFDKDINLKESEKIGIFDLLVSSENGSLYISFNLDSHHS